MIPKLLGKSERGSNLRRNIDEWVGGGLCAILSIFKIRGKSIPSKPSKIGVIVFGAIGDALLASSILNSLKNKYPHARICLILSNGNRGVADVLYAYDECTVVSVSRPFNAIAVIKKLQLDVLVDTSQWARISALISFFSTAKFTVGFSTKGQWRSNLYDLNIEHSNAKHELENFQSLALALGGDIAKPALREAVASIPNMDNNYIVVHPWASGSQSVLREWDLSAWTELILRLIHRGYFVYITGSNQDVLRSDILVDLVGADSGIASLAGSLSLRDLCSCLVGAKAVVAVNTGVMHLASLLECSVISLNGPTNSKRWGGVGHRTINIDVSASDGGAFLNLGFEYPRNPKSIMHKISVESVERAVLSAL